MNPEDNNDPWSEHPDMTMRWIENEGRIEREIANKPQKLIVVVAMYIIYAPCILASVVMIYTACFFGTPVIAIGTSSFFGLVGLLSLLMLLKTTRNYIKYIKNK